MRKLWIIVCIFGALILAIWLSLWFNRLEGAGDSKDNCPEGAFPTSAVAADSEQCSEIGLDILKKGGSAVDAAIAAVLCTSIINPQSAGIGGGSIFTVMDSSGKVTIINSRETAPQTMPSDMAISCEKEDEPKEDSRWIGVPGEIRGYEKAHRLYGKLKWADLFQPTIKLAREGFSIPKVQGDYISKIVKRERTLSLWKLYSDKNGNLLKAGDTVKFEKLADTLEMIAEQGPDVFYNGIIAKRLISDIQKAEGTLKLEDLASYKATVTDAWNISLEEYQMYFPPPPAGGTILGLILNIMKGYKRNLDSTSTEGKTFFYHRYVEALKFVNGLKKYIRDPKFSSEIGKKFKQDNFANDMRKLITEKTHKSQYYSNLYLDSMGTTHVSVLTKDGSAVSVTSSINNIFGSKVLSPSTGIILNDVLYDFCRIPHFVSPGEQPPSNMAPAVLKSQSKILVIGGSGGNMITTGMASALMNHLWFGKSLKDAINTPNVYVDSENAVKFEPNFEKDVIEALKEKGHNHQPATRFYNVVNAVEKEDSCISAWSDERKKGKAAGY